MPAAQPPLNGQIESSAARSAHAFVSYLLEIDACHRICRENEKVTAIHKRGEELQVYRQFNASPEIAESMMRSGGALPSWTEWAFWKPFSKTLEKLEKQIINRVERHKNQLAVYTRGICWECRPILIHAYKFEVDPHLKIELVVPSVPIKGCPDELPMQIIASAIRCHDFLVPPFTAMPLPPYAGHEARFETLSEYLRQTMPPNTYASQPFATHAAGDG